MLSRMAEGTSGSQVEVRPARRGGRPVGRAGLWCQLYLGCVFPRWRRRGDRRTAGRPRRTVRGHRRQRVGQPAGQQPPGLLPYAAEDARLRVAVAVRPEGAGAGRDEPAVRVHRIDRHRPCVVSVAALVGRLPGCARVCRVRGSAAARLVRAPLGARVPGQRVHVALGARPVILPAGAAVAWSASARPARSRPAAVRRRAGWARSSERATSTGAAGSSTSGATADPGASRAPPTRSPPSSLRNSLLGSVPA